MTIKTITDREQQPQKQLALAQQLAQLNGEIAAELKAERDTLRQQLAEAQALIEASRKQEPVATVGHELRPWEKAVLAPPHPGDFGIPKEHWEAAQHYANFWHLNRLDAVRVKQEAAQPVQVPLTAERIVSACYSFRHDFGLLPQETRDSLTRTATDWAQAFGIGGGQ